MTRAASGAQRSGAAAPIIIFAPSREDYATRHHYYGYSFFAALTPARWLRERMWAGPGDAGSLVPIGSGGRTAKRLKCNGSTVLFCGLTRDACTGAAARACVREPQNHRTIEPYQENGRIEPFLPVRSVLVRFCGSSTNKKGGEYHFIRFAAASSADQGLNTGTARRNFPAWRALPAGAVASIGAGRDLGERGAENGGILRFFEGVRTPVGMPLSEQRAESAVSCGFAGMVQQPARLAGRDLVGVLASRCTPRGVDAGRQGGTPPLPRVVSPCSLAQPIFGVSSQSRIRGHAGRGGDRDGRLISSAKTGSGVSAVPHVAMPRGGRAQKVDQQRRVGVQGAVLGWGRSRETYVLWGGLHGVN